MSRQTRENLQSKLDAFRTVLLIERRNRYRRPDEPPETSDPDIAADALLEAAVATILETHALVEALAAKKGIRR